MTDRAKNSSAQLQNDGNVLDCQLISLSLSLSLSLCVIARALRVCACVCEREIERAIQDRGESGAEKGGQRERGEGQV